MDTAISEHAKASHSESHVQRLNYAAHLPELFKKLADLSTSIRKGSIEASIIHLIEIRASQLNGCSLCLEMHVKEAKLHSERELRLYHVATWHESPLFEPRERAALSWTKHSPSYPWAA
jgi:AhpD family alkylhydroperoxidase